MIFDAAGPSFNLNNHVVAEEAPNANAAKFMELLEYARTPLYPGCEDHSPLEVVKRLLSIKPYFNIS